MLLIRRKVLTINSWYEKYKIDADMVAEYRF